MLNPDLVKKAQELLPYMTPKEQALLSKLVTDGKSQLTQQVASTSFLDFIEHVYPGYKVGPHHRKLAGIFEDVAAGKKKRVIVNIAPRHGKSEMISYLAPAWFLGKYPQKKVIMASHTADLAVNFGRRVRNLVGSDLYHDIFPNVELQADSKSASRWGTNFNGEFEPAWEWFQSGPVQRLMPGGAIIVVMTRWSKMDLTGKIIDHMTRNDGADQWEVVEFPAILNDQPLWPEFWSLDELLAKKASMDVRYWQAQYMQEPTSEEGALIKREWWRVWEKEAPPQCEHIIMSLDAAQEKSNRSDYNALTTWGIFFNEETKNYNIILLNSIKERMEFPELKQLVLDEYKDWQPDTFIVEKKSNGAALYQEMRRMGVPISEFTPGKGQDKISRVNAVVDLFSSGIVWCTDHRWAREVVEECNDFPSGTHDDLVDATTLALIRFRQGGFIRLPTDEPEPTKWFKSHKRSGFY